MVIGEVKKDHPEVDFSGRGVYPAEDHVSPGEARIHQSYTYFTWRNTKHELTEYFTRADPNRQCASIFARTCGRTRRISSPSISSIGGRPAFMTRLVLAATLGRQLWNLWPGFRACRTPSRASPAAKNIWIRKNTRFDNGNRTSPDSLSEFIARVNRIRRENRRCSTTESALPRHRLTSKSLLIQQTNRDRSILLSSS